MNHQCTDYAFAVIFQHAALNLPIAFHAVVLDLIIFGKIGTTVS